MGIDGDLIGFLYGFNGMSIGIDGMHGIFNGISWGSCRFVLNFWSFSILESRFLMRNDLIMGSLGKIWRWYRQSLKNPNAGAAHWNWGTFVGKKCRNSSQYQFWLVVQ